MSTELRTPSPLKASREVGDAQITYAGDLRKTCFAKIRRISSGCMELLTPIFIAVDQSVQVVYLDCRVESRVTRCVKLTESSYVMNVRLLRCGGMDVRSEPRVPLVITGTLQTLGSAEKHAVRVTDVSQSGLGMTVPISLTAGQQVSIDIGCGIAFGEVRYCRVIPEGYRAGLMLLEFLDRELSMKINTRLANPINRPKVDNILSLIRDRRDGLLTQSNESDTE